MRLGLSVDDVLSTTRSVRKRLDLNRPVEREVIEDCLRLAQQAPTGSNAQHWGFVVVTDPEKRRLLAGLYRQGWEAYTRGRPLNPGAEAYRQPDREVTQARLRASSAYLADRMQDVPVMVVPCVSPRTDGVAVSGQAAIWGSIVPAAWSFMLAARERGLGTVYTTLHLPHEQEAAQVLGIPYDRVMQTALIPVAYTLGTEFQPAKREPLDTLIHWNTW